MKLKNKKSGEIVENAYIRESHDFYNKRTIAVFVRDGNRPPDRVSTGYETLAELNEEWEDYEEPTGYWYIDFDGDILSCVEDFDEETDEERKSIGNYFETKEEAELAVRKLKAWKRLKDNGFKFETYGYDRETVRNGRVNIIIKATFDEKYGEYNVKLKDLDLLFSGGEE